MSYDNLYDPYGAEIEQPEHACPDITKAAVARQVLIEAAQLIEIHGLAKDEYEDEDGCLCTYGSLNTVINGEADSDAWINTSTWEQDPMTRALAEEMRSRNQNGGVPGSVSMWNDLHSTTQHDVVAMLRNAADRVTA